jgi:hypothetical protein
MKYCDHLYNDIELKLLQIINNIEQKINTWNVKIPVVSIGMMNYLLSRRKSYWDFFDLLKKTQQITSLRSDNFSWWMLNVFHVSLKLPPHQIFYQITKYRFPVIRIG